MRGPISDVARVAALAAAEEFSCQIVLYNGPINEDGLGAIVEGAAAHAEWDKGILLTLVTYGGSANSAYRIARFLQEEFPSFGLYVPSYCKSAGTLVALGAHRLIMSPFAELGPLDVQLLKPDELGEWRSGLLSRSTFASLGEHAFELFELFMLEVRRRSGGLISFKTASEVAASITSGLFSNVYSQVNPYMAGEDFRNLSVAYEYGLRLAGHGGNTIPEMVRYLVSGFPSHDFVIDKSEASSIFLTVDNPTASLYQMTAELGREFHASNVMG